MRRLALVFLAVLLAAGTMAGTAVAQTKLTIGIGNERPPQYHSFYLAKELGYFAEEGLDVDIQIISGASATIQQLIAGNIDVAICSPAALLNAVASGQGDLLTYYSYWYKNIFTLASPTSSGITSLDQLRGKTVGVSEASGGEIPFVRGAMAAAGLADGVDYEMLPIGDGGQLTYEALNSGRADAYSSSVFDVAAVSAAGLPLTDIMPDEFAYVPSININVARSTWDSQQEDLIKFARAVTKGTVFAQANPDAANAILARISPEIYENPALAQEIWDTTVASMQPPASVALDPTTQLGMNILPIWESYISFVSQGTAEEGALPGPVDLSQVVNNDAIAAINDFDHAAIVQQAQEYQP
jgi:ABC-type nitrate/sulfonate/bicarbonate transport system substrate-binding protein